MWIYAQTVIVPGIFWFLIGEVIGFIFAFSSIMIFESRPFEFSVCHLQWAIATAGPYYIISCCLISTYLTLSKRWALKEFLDQRIEVFNTVYDYNQKKIALNQEVNKLKVEIQNLKTENAKITKERDKLEIIIDENFRTKKD